MKRNRRFSLAASVAVLGLMGGLTATAGASSANGTLLGAVDDPAFVTCEVILKPGDAIVLCSDGIHDTEIDAVRVDEQRVAELLTGTPLADAHDLLDRLVGALRATQRPLRDDVAIMVIRHISIAWTPSSSDEAQATQAV